MTATPDQKPPRRPVTLRYLEDLTVGEIWEAQARTLTDAHFAAFQLASGGVGELHTNAELCRERGLPGLVANAFHVLIHTTPGASDMSVGPTRVAAMGMLEQSSRFLRPVYAGDTLYSALTLADLKPQNTTGVMTVRSTAHNQRGELCLEGEMKMLVRRRPKDA